MILLSRMGIIGLLLSLTACSGGPQYVYNRAPVPSAARGGILPSDQLAQRHGPVTPAPAPIAVIPPVSSVPAPPVIVPSAPVELPPQAEVPIAPSVPAIEPPVEPVTPPAIPLAAAPMSEADEPEPPPVIIEASAPPQVVPPPTAPAANVEAAAPVIPLSSTGTTVDATVVPVNAGDYVLGTGDELRIMVYGEQDLSGQYQIGSTGIVALPLVGNVQAAGRTIGQFEAALRAKLSQGYLKNPRVSVQVAAYRPFYILGEVAKPGGYPYVNGMTALSAVAVAGGYTYRADHGDIRVVHARDPKAEQDIDQSAPIMPGDIIRVTERYF